MVGRGGLRVLRRRQRRRRDLGDAAAMAGETGHGGSAWPISEIEIRDDDGAPVPVGEPGTVWIAMGEHRFTYHGDEAKTREAWSDRFFTVGDAGYLDEDGWLYLCDRKADMIISGGVNIYPAEIEAVLLRHDQVLDAAVFGVPDEDWGEAVHAVLQLRPDAGEVEAEVRRFCAEQLARYKQRRATVLSTSSSRPKR